MQNYNYYPQAGNVQSPQQIDEQLRKQFANTQEGIQAQMKAAEILEKDFQNWKATIFNNSAPANPNSHSVSRSEYEDLAKELKSLKEKLGEN